MPTPTFDDGSASVPSAATGEAGRVIVVGAGIAGLTVANALTTAGIDCAVVEARDRIAGRLHTADLAGHPADLGGAWIHHPDGGHSETGRNVLAQWVEAAGVPWIVDPTGRRFSGADLGERRTLTPSEVDEVGYGALDSVAEWLTEHVEGDLPASEAVDAYLAATMPAGPPRDRLRQLIASAIEQDAAGPLAEISARWALTGGMLVGDVVDHVPVDGYRSVLAPLAAGSEIRLGRPVQRITTTDDGVVVSGDGWSESGSHVVVTVPLGVLKAGALAFDLPLPPERRALIERTGFGTMEKVFLAFDEPFWRERDPALQHSILYPADRTEAATWTWDFGLAPTLMFLVAASAVPAMQADPCGWALEQLELLYGDPLPAAPAAWTATDWAHDEFARGAYAHIRTGQEAADFARLGEPVGRICFAGEHTSADRQGYADGAMESGLREAKRLLQRPSVELTVS